MEKQCTNCSATFTVTPDDVAFLRSISPKFAGKTFELPNAEECPACRHQRRCAFRNESVLYHRTCDLCKKPTITIFSGDRKFPVYCQTCWWGSGWDGATFGRDVDFSRPFLDQVNELRDVLPRLSMNNAKAENSEYCNQCVGNKNCYLLFAADDNQDSMYGRWINRCTDTYNSSNLADCTLCADLVDCQKCYQCFSSQDLVNCTDCSFCFDCIGCRNCIGCAGLRNKEYFIDNVQHSKEDYEQKSKAMQWGSEQFASERRAQLAKIRLQIPHKYVHIINAEDCTGDYIADSKNCRDCFDILESEDCAYAYSLVHKQYRNVDVSYVTECRNVYQVMSCIAEGAYFSTLIWYSSDAWYCEMVASCQNMFGCVCMQHKKHCILNKQYSKEEYDALVARIIEHMQKDWSGAPHQSPAGSGAGQEWGKFFPKTHSPFAYNETVAHDEFPLTKETAAKQGFPWREIADDAPRVAKIIPADKIPDRIEDIPDDVTQWAITCQVSKKPFRILKQELDFYRRLHLPLPRLHPDERQQQRTALRNPRKLWSRACAKCKKAIETTYAPERPEKVYCEECYLKEVY